MDLDPVALTPTLPFSRKLPLELWDYIIDALADDKDPRTRALPEATDRALRNCCLVCHSWLSRAKLHLRRMVYIEDVNTLTGLAQRMSAASTALSPHVPSLGINFPEDGRYPPSNVLTLLPMLFRLGISSINRLSLSCQGSGQIQSEETEQKTACVPYLPLHPRFPSLVTPVLSTVRQLTITDVTFRNFSDFGRFLNCFLCLENLFCDHVRWLTLGVVPGCMTHKKGRTFLPHLLTLNLHRISTYGINRVLAALPGQLSTLFLEFYTKSERDVQDVSSDPISGENARMSLARFTKLEKIIVDGYQPEHFQIIWTMLQSWKPTKVSSRYLRVSLTWSSMQSVLSPGEETGNLGQNVSALDENWSSDPPLAIQFMVLSIPRKYEDKEEDIWIKMMAFFPKASEEGRLEVELQFHDD